RQPQVRPPGAARALAAGAADEARAAGPQLLALEAPRPGRRRRLRGRRLGLGVPGLRAVPVAAAGRGRALPARDPEARPRARRAQARGLDVRARPPAVTDFGPEGRERNVASGSPAGR